MSNIHFAMQPIPPARVWPRQILLLPRGHILGLRVTPSTETFRVGIFGCVDERDLMLQIRTALGLADINVELVAVADTDHERAIRVADQLGVNAAWASFAEMLERSRLDGVIVASSPKEQMEVVMPALANGLHVLCTEALGPNLAEAQEMARYARTCGQILAAGAAPPLPVVRVLEDVRSGAYGGPNQVEASSRYSLSGPDRARGEEIVVELMHELLSWALPALGSPAGAVTARRWNSKVKNSIDLVVDCENGARGHLVATCGSLVAVDQIGISYEGDRGFRGVRLTAETEEDEAALLWPTAFPEPDEVGRGELYLSIAERLALQQRDWVGACRNPQALRSRPEAELDVHRVLVSAGLEA